MKRSIKSLDLFGIAYNFKTNGEEKYKTLAGGLITVSCLIITVVFTFLFGSNFFFKKNPYVTNQQVFPDDYPDPFLLTNQNFLIPWRVTDDNFNIVNVTEVFFPLIWYFELVKNETGIFLINQDTLNYTSCSNVNFTIPALQSRDVNNYYCVDWSKYNYSFGGGWDSGKIQFVQFRLGFCEDAKPFSNNTKCTEKATAQKYLGGSFNSYIEFLYPQYYFDPYDREQPQKINYYQYWYAMSFDIQKIDRLFFTQQVLYDDLGWILRDDKVTTVNAAETLKFDYLSFNADNYGKEGQFSKLYEMNFYSNKSYMVTRRAYMKVQDLTAIIGGFLQGILLIGNCLSFIFYKLLRDEEIINHLFKFEKNTSSTQTKILNKKGLKFEDIPKDISNNYLLGPYFDRANSIRSNKQSVEIIDNSASNLPGDNSSISIFKKIELNHKNTNHQSAPIKIIKSQSNPTNKKKFSYTYSYLMKSICFCFKDKSYENQVYSFTTNYIRQKTDILHYFYLLHSFETFKNVMLNEQQIIFMNHLNKTNMFNYHEFDRFCSAEKELENQNFDNFLNYLQNKKLSNSMDEKDSKILDLLLKDNNFN